MHMEKPRHRTVLKVWSDSNGYYWWVDALKQMRQQCSRCRKTTPCFTHVDPLIVSAETNHLITKAGHCLHCDTKRPFDSNRPVVSLPTEGKEIHYPNGVSVLTTSDGYVHWCHDCSPVDKPDPIAKWEQTTFGICVVCAAAGCAACQWAGYMA